MIDIWGIPYGFTKTEEVTAAATLWYWTCDHCGWRYTFQFGFGETVAQALEHLAFHGDRCGKGADA